MRDVIIRQGIIVKFIEEDGNEKYDSLDKFLPIDRVVTIDGNNCVYLYDKCINIEENMIVKEL